MAKQQAAPKLKKRTLAPHPFWLDGGYDRESDMACRYHPHHHWVTFRLGDVLVPGACSDPTEQMTICKGCGVPRCGTTADEDTAEGRCIYPRHHYEMHRCSPGAHSLPLKPAPLVPA